MPHSIRFLGADAKRSRDLKKVGCVANVDNKLSPSLAQPLRIEFFCCLGCLTVFFMFAQNQIKVLPRILIVRVELQGFLEVRDSLRGFSQVKERDS